MLIATKSTQRECDETEIYTTCLSLAGARIVELGCGAAQHTLSIAAMDPSIEITAYEIDEIQHQKNLQSNQPNNVSFKLAGAQSIPEPEQSFDIVMMFKSLHHVPLEDLEASFTEIHRVLKPGGFAYISEPVFAGEFNEILRLFHDEESVREAAFSALVAAVEAGLFENADEIFFNAPVKFNDFADFENKIIKATHSDHQLDTHTARLVKQRIEQYVDAAGIRFSAPMRVNLLRKLG
jgi:SAM-dependent methyltransferase